MGREPSSAPSPATAGAIGRAAAATTAAGANMLLLGLMWLLQGFQEVPNQVERARDQHLHSQVGYLAHTPPQPVQGDAQAGEHGGADCGALRRCGCRRRGRKAWWQDGWQQREWQGRWCCCSTGYNGAAAACSCGGHGLPH